MAQNAKTNHGRMVVIADGEATPVDNTNTMTDFFNLILVQPLFNLLVFLQNLIPGGDFGIAIIALTIIIKLVLFPLNKKAIIAQRDLQKVQPQLQELQTKYKDNKEKLAQETMALYKKNKVNPLGGCLPLLIQLPILLALFNIFRKINEIDLGMLYSFVAQPEVINTTFLGIADLSEKSYEFALIAGLLQFIQAKFMQERQNLPKPDKNSDKPQQAMMMQAMQKQMLYFMPVITVFISASLPGALPLYWGANTLFTILQEKFTWGRGATNEE